MTVQTSLAMYMTGRRPSRSPPVITPIRTYIRQGSSISVLSSDDASAVIDSGFDAGSYEPRGLFISPEMTEIPGYGEVPIYIAMDNTSGDCWTEEFYSRTVAEKWLIGGYGCIEDAQTSDIRYIERMLKGHGAAMKWIRGRFGL